MWVVMMRSPSRGINKTVQLVTVGPFDSEQDAKNYVEGRLQAGKYGRPFSVHEVVLPDSEEPGKDA